LGGGGGGEKGDGGKKEEQGPTPNLTKPLGRTNHGRTKVFRIFRGLGLRKIEWQQGRGGGKKGWGGNKSKRGRTTGNLDTATR